MPVLVSLFVVMTIAQAPKRLAFNPDVSTWKEVVPPLAEQQADFMVWSYAANYSNMEWSVSSAKDKTVATLNATATASKTKPSFVPKAGRFSGGSDFAKVDDGWLVGFNQGEFGAALYWFGNDGKQSYKISDHQIVGFFSRKDGLYAIEGLAHLSLSRGSVISLHKGKTWEAKTAITLPFAPYAVSLRKDDSMVVTLSDALVCIGNDWKIQKQIDGKIWGGLYPHVSMLSKNEAKAYLGMRQYVGEVDLGTGKIRMLIPSDKFLNKLPAEEVKSLRRIYGG
jgi:hypothetical protein